MIHASLEVMQFAILMWLAYRQARFRAELDSFYRDSVLWRERVEQALMEYVKRRLSGGEGE